MEQISHMPTDWTSSTFVTDLSDDDDDDDGAELDKAQELGVAVLDWDGFQKLIEG